VNGILLRRSALFVPASRAGALTKVRTLPVDMVVVDLEDAVAPEEKDEARATAVAAIREGGFGDREILLRVNGLDSPWSTSDLAAAARLDVDGILIPKVRGPRDILAASNALSGAPDTVRLWAMVETCEALVRLPAIARTSRLTRLGGLVLGTNDLGRELGIRTTGDRAPLLHALAAMVSAARAYGLAALDGVCNRLDDANSLLLECEQGRAFGFDGKTLIHPNQIVICNDVYSPRNEDVSWAKSVLDAFAQPQNAGKGAIRVGNEMIELLHLEQARRVIAVAEEIRRRR
jgi:citrate lyase subunit beta / citryl-CoA lyase